MSRFSNFLSALGNIVKFLSNLGPNIAICLLSSY